MIPSEIICPICKNILTLKPYCSTKDPLRDFSHVTCYHSNLKLTYQITIRAFETENFASFEAIFSYGLNKDFEITNYIEDSEFGVNNEFTYYKNTYIDLSLYKEILALL